MVLAFEPYKDPRKICGIRATYFLRYLSFSKIVFDTAFLVADLIVWNGASNRDDRILGPVLWGVSLLVALFGVYVSFVPTQLRTLTLLLSAVVIFLLSVSLGVWRFAEYTRGTVDTNLGPPSIVWLVAWLVSSGVCLVYDVYFYGMFLGPASPSSRQFGVGLRLIRVAEGFKIEHVLIGGPAWVTGAVFPGDVIVSVDGSTVQNRDTISPLLWGPSGSQVMLGIWRYPNALSKIIYITVIRGPLSPVPADVQQAATATATGHYPTFYDEYPSPSRNEIRKSPAIPSYVSPPKQSRDFDVEINDEAETEWALRSRMRDHELSLGIRNESDVAEALVKLAKTYANHGRITEAASVMEKALTARQEAYGATDPRTARVAVRLGAIYRLAQRHEDAGRLLLAALRALVVGLGNSHPEIGKAAWHLGKVYEDQGQLTDAECAYTDAVAVVRSCMPSLATPIYESKLKRLMGKTLASLFHLSIKIGKIAEADAAVHRVQKARGLDEPFARHTSVTLASQANHEQAKLAEAEEAYLRALNLEGLRGVRIGYTDGTTPGWVDIPQIEELDVGQALHAIGNVYRKQNRIGEAEEMLQRAIRVLGASAAVHGRDEDNQSLAHALSDLALVDHRAGRNLEAQQGFERAMSIFERLRSRVGVSSQIEVTAAALETVRATLNLNFSGLSSNRALT